MYEMLAKKEFGICEIPEDIQKKREKKQAKENKANEAAKPESEMTEEEKKKAEKKKATAARTAKNARVKKIKTQIEGLDLVEKVVMELMSAGLGTMEALRSRHIKSLQSRWAIIIFLVHRDCAVSC